jgi:hypothetical protein
MASTSAPYGMQPISDQTGTPRPLRIPNGIHNGLASYIYKYQPVFIDVTYGTITPVTAITDKIFGVFAGVEYTPVGGRPTVSPIWPTGLTYDTGYDMFVYVWPAWVPGMRWAVQADGTVAQALLGSGFNFSTATVDTGNTTTGLSTASVLHAGVAASSQAQVALVEFGNGINSAVGDAYTDLIVSVAYPQVVSGFQTSIG